MDPDEIDDAAPAVPGLPMRLADPRPPLLLGSTAFAVGAAVTAVIPAIGTAVTATCVSGALLGACGYGVLRLQEAAVRRGSPGGQDGIADGS